MFPAEWRRQGVWHSFPFLAWDLSMHQRTKIWFFNQFICTGACACSSNLIMHINALKTQLMRKNAQTNPEKSQKITQHSCCSMLTWQKIWKQQEPMDIVSSPKVGRSLPKTIMLVMRSCGLWEAYTQTCPKWDKMFTTACWCRSMVACQVSWILDEFWIY